MVVWFYRNTACGAARGIKTELGTGTGTSTGKDFQEICWDAFINHQWGGKTADYINVNVSTIQVFNVFLPAKGWSVASGPIITLKYNTKQWEVPLNFAVGKTVNINDIPWKFAVELNYYFLKYDVLGPRWMFGVNVAPVVKNVFYNWFK